MMTTAPSGGARDGSDRFGSRRGGPLIAAVPFRGGGPGVPSPLLSAEERRRLALIASIANFPKGARLYEEGDEADCIYNVVQGEVKTFCALSSGKRRITAFLFPGDLAGLAENGRYVNTAQAVTPVTAYRLPLSALESLLRSDPELERHFLCKVCNELRAAQWHAVTLGRNDARGKLAMFVQMLEHSHSPDRKPGGHIHLPMTRSDIADYLGLSLEAVSRSFRRLQRSGIVRVTDLHNVRIVDRAQFERLVAAT